jgi:ATP synthase protein I
MGQKRMSKKPPPTVWETLGSVGGLGLAVAVPIVVCVILGAYLDGVLHTAPLLTLLGLLLGLLSGVYGAYRLLKNFFSTMQ